MPGVPDREAIDMFVLDTLVALGVDRSRITRESSFTELDVDSLDIVELSQIIRTGLEIPIRSNDFDDTRTVGQLLEYLYKTAGSA
jgi:acyl carrier protein